MNRSLVIFYEIPHRFTIISIQLKSIPSQYIILYFTYSFSVSYFCFSFKQTGLLFSQYVKNFNNAYASPGRIFKEITLSGHRLKILQQHMKSGGKMYEMNHGSSLQRQPGKSATFTITSSVSCCSCYLAHEKRRKKSTNFFTSA